MQNRRQFIKTTSLGAATVLTPFNPGSALFGKLPKVLLIGDSISMGYYPFVKDSFFGKAEVLRPMKSNGDMYNCQGTTNGVLGIADWIADIEWDVIHFNFGLHDIKHIDWITKKNSNSQEDPHQASPKQYGKNLKFIVKKLKKTEAKLIFATTTPYPNTVRKPLRKPGMSKIYNEVALKIMAKNNIQVNDLYNYVLPKMEKLQRPNNVHFSLYGSQKLAEKVVTSISKNL